MRIVDRKFVDKNIHTTRTRQHFGALLGEKPHVMGTEWYVCIHV
jgi:hypothetical protein